VTVVGGPVDLAVGAVDSTTFSATYTITADDIVTGYVLNQATATGTDPDGNTTTDESDDNSTTENNETNTTLTTVAPVAVDDNKSGVIGEAVTIDATGNDSDENNDLNTSTVHFTDANATDSDGDGDNDTLVVPGEGTWTVDENGTVTFTPEAGFTGDPTPVEYTVKDNTGKVSNSATITVDYTQEAAIAVIKRGTVNNGGDGLQEGDTITYTFEVSNTGNVPLSNVSITDPKVTVVGGPVDLAVGAVDSTTFSATYTITADDIVTGYVLNQATATGTDPDGNTTTDESDDNSTTENNETNTTLTTVAPVAVDDNKSGVVGEAVTIDATGNDSDENNDLNKSTVHFTDANATDSDGDGDNDTLVVTGEGTWTVDENGTVTFTPEAGFTGDPTPVEYTVKDNTGKVSNSATIGINYANPVVAEDDSKEGIQGEPVTQDVLVNDSGDNPLDSTTVNLDPTSVPNGVGKDTDSDGDIDKVTVPGEGVWTVDDTGKVTFTPETGFTEDPTPIKYTVKDKQGNISNTATITIDYPQVINTSDDYQTGELGESVTVEILDNDRGDNGLDPETVNLDPTSVSGRGEDTDNDGDIDKVTVEGEGVWTVDAASGAITFTPNSNFLGDPTPIKYTVKDSVGITSTPATVSIDYPQSINAVDDRGQGTLGKPITIDVLKNDSADNDLDPTSVRILDAQGNPTPVLVVPGEGKWSVDTQTGKITFTPEAGFNGSVTPIKYIVSDTEGNEATGYVRITYPVGPCPPPPCPSSCNTCGCGGTTGTTPVTPVKPTKPVTPVEPTKPVDETYTDCDNVSSDSASFTTIGMLGMALMTLMAGMFFRRKEEM